MERRMSIEVQNKWLNHSSRIRILHFLENPKTATLRFFETTFKKRNPKFEVLDFADFSLHGISTTAQKQCMFIIYVALVVV